jgi:hypothetical protein
MLEDNVFGAAGLAGMQETSFLLTARFAMRNAQRAA